MRTIASSVNFRSMPSVESRAAYCFGNAFSGSFKMRMKSLSFRGSTSTRIGNLPCNSGIISDGFETWKAPAAIKSMWSVRTMPYRVLTDVPSMIGRRSRWTPSRLTSGPCPLSLPAILSSSSRKTIPDCSTRTMASLAI